MEAMKLLTVALAVLLVSLTAYLRRSRLFYTPRPMPTILVGDPDVTRRLLIDHADAFSDHPILPLGIDLDAGHPSTTSITSAPHGPFWRALRRNLTVNILHPSRVGALQVPLQRRAVEALVAGLSSAVGPDGGEVEVRDAIYAAVFATVARLCVGEDGDGGLGERDVGAMRSLLRDFFHSDVGPTLLLTSRWARLVHWRKWRQLVGLRGRLAEVFGPAIAARRLSRGRRGDADGDGGGGGGACGSYLDALIDVRVPAGCDDSDGGDARRELRDDEIVKLMWEFLGASTEAVVASVEWTLARLVAEPEVQEKLHRGLTGGDRRNGQVPPEERLRDTPYLRAVVLESLRLHPPLPMLIRDVGPEGAAAAGFAPPPPPDGSLTRFLFNAEVIGRDAKAWTDPDEFRPERFLAGGEGEDVGPVPGLKEIKMVPFGAGRRHCPGAGLSMVHVGGIVAALVREFEWAPPAGGGGGGVDLKAVTALFVRVMASPLRARVTPRLAPS